MAVNSSDIGIAMKASANSLSVANNSLSESVALIATANKTVQDSSKVGNALRTIAMRIRGVSEDADELLPKMQDLIKSATNGKVDIMDGEDFKSTYQIMLEISEVWDELSDKQQAYLSESVAGKNRAEVFNAIMGNAEDLTYAMEVAKDSLNSADEEMAIVMQSFEKRVELMQNAWASLANTTMSGDLAKGVVDATTSIIQFADACGGLTPVILSLVGSLTALKAIEAYNEGKLTIDTIKKIASAMLLRKTATDATTASTVALSLAEKTLVSGMVVAGVMAIGYAIHQIATASERAKEKVVELKSEVSDINKNIAQLSVLGEEFQKLKEKESFYDQNGLKMPQEESKKLFDIQNQIKELQPEISGYYDEQGNFIITQVSTAKELLEIEKEKLKIKKQEALEASKDVVADSIENYQKQKEAIENANKEIEKMKRVEEGTGSLWDKISMKGIRGDAENNPITKMEDRIKNSKDNIQDYAEDIKTFLVDAMSLDDNWEGLGEESANGIRKLVSEMDAEKAVEFAKQLIENKVSVEDLIKTLENQVPTIEEVNKSVSNASGSKELVSIGVVAEEVANNMDILKVAQGELNSTQQISEATMKKLLSKYPELAEKIKDVESAQLALNQKMAENKFDEATQGIADLVSISEDLEAGNGLTASSFKKISSSFPELLAYMDDEASLADAIKRKMNELKDTQSNAYREMLMNSQEYYQQNILGNEKMVNSISKGITDLFNNLGSAYEGDLKNWKSLADGKAKIESQLINELNKAWASHFGQLMTQFNKMSNTPIAKAQFDRESYAQQLKAKNPLMTDKQLELNLDATEQAFNKQAQQIQEYYKAIANVGTIFSDIEFDAIDIKVGGSKASSSGSSSKSDSSKTSSYIASIFKDIVDDILRGGEEIETAMDEANTKLENAILKGDTETEEQLKAKLANLQVALRDKQASMAKELEVEMGKMKDILSKSGLFNGYDLSNLTDKNIAEINQKLDIQINSANLAGNDALVDQLNKQKSLVNDVGQVYIDTLQKRRELSDIWWQEENNRLENYADNLEEFYKKKFDKLDKEDKLLELRKSMLLEDGGVYDKEEKEADKIFDINKQLYANIVKRRQLCETQIAELRAKGFNDESTYIKELQDKWLDYEQARLDMIKEIAEARRQNAIDSANNELSDLNNSKEYIKDLLDLTIDMLKQETEAKKEVLQDQYENKKDALEKEYNAEKEALEDRLDLLKKEADARKEALDKEKSDRDYAQKIEEKQKEIQQVREQIVEISNDTSISGIKKRKELEEKLAEYLKELEDIQYDRSHELQKDAIEEELKSQQDKINEELDNLKDQYDEEKDLLEDKYKDELKEYEKYLKNQAQLKEEASKLIESKDKAFYERLKQYALEYTDTLGVEFDDMWDKAYTALDRYGSKQMDIISIIELMTQKVIELTDELERLDDTSYKDFIQDEDYEYVGDKNNSSGSSNSSSGNTWTDDKYVGKDTEEERNKYIDEQLQKMIALGDQMKGVTDNTKLASLREQQRAIAKTIGAWEDKYGTWHIQRKDKIYPIRQAVGIRHNGILGGRLGDDLKANEIMLKATTDEWVLTGQQYDNLTSNLSKMLSLTSSNKNTPQNEATSVVIDMHDFSVTQDSLPKLEKLLKDRIPKIINETIFSKGIKK